MTNNRVVFMGGTMRSGTSLTRAIVGSHSKIAVYPRDLPLWSKFYNQYEDRIIEDVDTYRSIIEAVLAHKKGGYQEEPFLNAAVAYFNEKPFTVPGFIDFFLENYKDKLNKEIAGLKTPNNEVFADEIFRFFPNAKFIHLIRDPRNTESSRLRMTTFWGDEPGYHLKVWKRSVRLAFENEQKYKGKYLIVKYEELVQNLPAETKRICEFLEVEFEEGMLSFEGLEDWSGANSSFDKVQGGQINTDSLNRYKQYLPKYRRFLCQWKLEKELKSIGYERDDLQLNHFRILLFKFWYALDPRQLKSVFRAKTKTYRV